MSLSSLPIPRVPWQMTGNHWLALPCIHPASGAVHAVGLVHRGTRSAIEFAGGAGFANGDGPPLLRPVIEIDGVERGFADAPMAWERALGWLPTFTCQMGPVLVRGTVFAPFGRDADVAGAVYAISVESRSDAGTAVRVALDGTLGHRQLRVRTPRPFVDEHRLTQAGDVVLLDGTAEPGLVTLAVGADGDAEIVIEPGSAPRFTIRRAFTLAPGAREQVAFYVAAGPERDGAQASVRVLRRRGWRELLAGTRDALQSLAQSTGSEAMDGLINRNLLFSYFYGVGRGLDDAHYYLMRTRVPWHGAGVTVQDWQALMWTVPAVQLGDPALARELILRACELHGYAPGRGVNYLDGTLFEAGFSLEGAAAYPLAAERYIRDTNDDRIVEEPVLADTLYAAHDELSARRDRDWPLYSGEVGPSGEPLAHPFSLHGNAVVAQALDVLRRTLDEESAREVQEPEAVRAALLRHFLKSRGGTQVLASSIDMAGGASLDDDPAGSALWLPLYETLGRHDSNYRRTAKAVAAGVPELVQCCARLIGPESSAALAWLRRAPLDGGLAAEYVDADGRATGNGGDASLSGLLAWTVWYAVHVLGERP
ncbi:MAG TPA: hypothetical protein VFT41_09375 [Gemmatimonadaceae bacterium]|nr:hypothetical protein [Gemmatimonadaceae bacterium]